jgi:Xaa-Pro aminopeptidase
MMMFTPEIYTQRRDHLQRQLNSGIVLLLGNQDSSMNFADNVYPFRQDSTFLYYIGLDEPGLFAVMDMDAGTTRILGDDVTVEQLVWTGRQPTLKEKCESIGTVSCAATSDLSRIIETAQRQKRSIHVLPTYRPEHQQVLQSLLGKVFPSEDLIRAVVGQRSVKASQEVQEIESALDMTHDMFIMAMQQTEPGKIEREVVGAITGRVNARGLKPAFPMIFSIRGEILHNPTYNNTMKTGDIVVYDAGAESALHYASDITRTIPVSGRFTDRQKEIYQIVLTALKKAIAAVTPGVEFRSVHRLAAVELLSGLKQLGVVKGDVEEAVEANVHTLFFPCGVGHMMGLDVHDMEPLGEDYIGYTDTIKRNPAFGWRSLRLAKALEPGYVITVEPGIYFIPELIDRRRADNEFVDFVDYHALEAYRDFGGVRIEEDLLVTKDGHRILGKPIPKTIDDVEKTCGS